MKLVKVWLICSIFLFAHSVYASLRINELMPCNISSYMDTKLYNFSAYVELYNDQETDVSLKNYKFRLENLTESGDYELKWEWTVSETITVSAESYKLVFFDNVDTADHAPYKLDTDGGILFLYDASGALVDSLLYKAMYTHVSYGRYETTSGYMEPSPKAENTASFTALSSGRCKKPTFSGGTPGVQTSNLSVSLECKTSNATIYYTTDGSEPTATNGTLYEEPFSITSTTCIRARAYADGFISSPILTGSFIYVDSNHNDCGGGFTVPVVSITTDEDYFYDDVIGISTVGTNGAPSTMSCLSVSKANFLQDWKRPVNFEYIVDGEQVVSQEMEAAVMGGCSRSRTIKSLKLKGGKKLGKDQDVLYYDFFEDKIGNEYKSLQLRNGGNAYDETGIRFRDGYMQALSKVMNVDYQAYQPVAYYLNGEYLGLMGLRERTDEDYVEANYGLEEENIDVLSISNEKGVDVTVGDVTAYNNLISYLENNDPSSSSYYEGASRMMDMDEYIDYQIFEQFIVNTDWPANNMKLWREKDNGRFRWIIFDTDFGLGLYGAYASNYCDVSMNSIEWCTGTGSKFNWANGESTGGTYVYSDEAAWKTTMFKHLMQNPTFKERFLNRSLIHLGTTFTKERVNAVWDSLAAVVKNEYCACFGVSDVKTQSAATSMIDFAEKRPGYIYDYLQSYYGLGDLVDLKFSGNVDGAKFVMNDELVNLSSFSGKYYKNKPLTLKVYPPDGYAFDHWECTEGNNAVSLLDVTSKWKYYYTKEGLSSSDWYASSTYDYSLWQEGTGKFGYASDLSSYTTQLDYGTTDDKYLTAYFVTSFNISNINNINSITADIIYDDSYIIYINGVEYGRRNITADDVTPTTTATESVNDASYSFSIPTTNFKTGENTIAIEVHQISGTSTDLTLQFNLAAEMKSDASAIVYNDEVFQQTVLGNKTILAVFEKVSCTKPTVVLNEICATSDSLSKNSDEYGNYPDWIEIYNYGTDTVDVAGLYLTDDTNDLLKSQIPYGYKETILEPNGHLVIWADNKTFRGPLHADFKLSNTVPTDVALSYFCNSGRIISNVTYAVHEKNSSYGRQTDNASTWMVFGETCSADGLLYLATPAAENGSAFTSDGCSTTTETSEEIAENEGMILYPNPVVSELFISLSDAAQMKIYIYDNSGRIMMQKVVSGAEVTLNLNDFYAGIYNLKVVTDNAVYQQPFIKK